MSLLKGRLGEASQLLGFLALRSEGCSGGDSEVLLYGDHDELLRLRGPDSKTKPAREEHMRCFYR
jgi:hypothetical protein